MGRQMPSFCHQNSWEIHGNGRIDRMEMQNTVVPIGFQ